MARNRLKKIAIVLGACAAVVILIIAALPLWFPWVLRPAAERYGLRFGEYERVGYGRWAATDAVFSNKSAVFKAERVETLTPTAWLWDRWFTAVSQPAVEVNDWTLTTRPSGRRGTGPGSTFTNVQRLDRILGALREWLPSAVLSNGTINNRELTLKLPAALWNDGILTGQMHDPQRDLSADLRAVVRSNRLDSLRIGSESLQLTSKLERVQLPNQLQLRGYVLWRTNDMQVRATFERQGVLPDAASATATNVTVPAELLRLKPYKDLHGRFALEWRKGSFEVQAAATAQPQENTRLPALTLNLQARGDTNRVVVESAQLTSAVAHVELSEAVTIGYSPPYLTEDVALQASAELGQQEWVPASGQVSAEVFLTPTNAPYPAATFKITGRDIVVSNLAVNAVNVIGGLQWPLLSVSNLKLELSEGAALQAQAALNLASNVVERGTATLRSPHGHGLLPEDLSVSNVVVKAAFRGPYQALAHAGSVEVSSFVTPLTAPLQLSADWEAHHLQFTNIQVQTLADGPSKISLRLDAELGAAERRIQLEQFNLITNGHTTLKLAAPATLTLRPSAPGTNQGFVLSLTPLRLVGDAMVNVAGKLQWPAYGRLTNTVSNLSTEMFKPFLRAPLPPAKLERMEWGAAWSNGPVTFAMEAGLRAQLTNTGPVQLTARGSGSGAGLVLQDLSIASDGAPAVIGEGFLPISFRPGSGLSFHEDESLNFRLSTVPSAGIWQEVGARAGLALEDPNIEVLLGGSWKNPEGTIKADLERLLIQEPSRPLPTVSDLSLYASVNRQELEVEKLHIEVEGQPLEVTATLPLGEQFWNSVMEKKVAYDWKQVTARLAIDPVELQSFAAFLPEVIAPQGRFHLYLSLRQGEWDGVARLQDVRTRPLPGLGPVREVDLRARLKGREIALEPIDAMVGGRQVRAEGTVWLPPNLWPTKELPPFHFRLWGANVPLARRPDAIIRADLELELTNSPALKAPEITGGINLRNSYYLSDLADLVPGGVAGPKRRPPYFSITNETLDDWRLDVNVRGEDFIKIRSPLFRGAASTTLRLEGTLEEPVALGEVRIDAGRILFPFATLEVQQGFVTLSSSDPYRPHLNITASTRRVGYEIKVEVTGPADEPVVMFSSSPPLSPEQIVLMLTAGQMPVETARLSTEQRAQRMALFLGGNLLRDFGIGGGDEERLSVRSGEQLTETGSQTYEVEYKLTDDLSLVGEYDRFNQFNAGLKWRVYSK